jgi:hypothetical protein
MLVAVAVLISCQKNTEVTAAGPQVNFIFKFDSTQARLNGQGNPSVLRQTMQGNHRDLTA